MVEIADVCIFLKRKNKPHTYNPFLDSRNRCLSTVEGEKKMEWFCETNVKKSTGHIALPRRMNCPTLAEVKDQQLLASNDLSCHGV